MDGRIVEHALAVPASVVEERPAELLEQEIGRMAAKALELLLERLGPAERARHEHVGKMRRVRESERVDPPPNPWIEHSHVSHPRMVERVVLWSHQHVQAQHALQER
jgi:hypothetical protein